MQSLSLDLRRRIVAALNARDRRADIAARFQVSQSSVYRLQRQVKNEGDLAPKQRPGRGHSLKDEELAQLDALVQQQADPTGESLVVAWEQKSGKRIGLSTMYRALNRLQMSYKKSAASPASATSTGDAPSASK